jgi:endonuclease/exonuclease/phosphatase (EEP) superfamily protein YafD
MVKAAEIARRIQAEKDPVIIAGDFNTPAFGPIYRLFGDVLQDAHLIAGSALGQTFPGDTRNPLAFFHPWLRLDQVFASAEWEVAHCQPQPVRSQHLPVFAVLRHRGGALRPSELFQEDPASPLPGTSPAPPSPP